MKRDPARPGPYVGGDNQPHNYLTKLYRLARQLSAFGGAYHFRVSHDDWCAYFHGRACNCNPIVREMTEGNHIKGGGC